MKKNILRKPFQYSYNNITLCLIVINVVVFALECFFSNQVISLLALNPVSVLRGELWQPLTYMFVHSPYNWSHIIFNMIALFIFGRALERYIGSKEFLLYYLVTGTLAGLASFGSYVLTNSFAFLMGASGALFAVQLAFAAFFPHTYIYVWGILPLRAPVMVLLFTLIELGSGLFVRGSNVAHATHLFGFAAGILYFFVRWGANPFKMMFGRQ